jgi:uncharacterized membrane protein
MVFHHDFNCDGDYVIWKVRYGYGLVLFLNVMSIISMLYIVAIYSSGLHNHHHS